MPFTVYVTDDGSTAGAAPVLIMSNDQVDLPDHPHGQAWRWAFTSTEEPHKALIGRQLVGQLKEPGWVITDTPLDRLLRVRAGPGPSSRYGL